MKHPALFLVFLSIALLSCRKEKGPGPEPVPHLATLVGNYEWLSTTKKVEFGTYNPTQSHIWVATDSTDRYGISICDDRTVYFFKNQQPVDTGMIYLSLDDNVGGINVYVGFNQGTSSQTIYVKEQTLNTGSFPISPDILYGSPLPCTNYYKKTGDVPTLPFEHIDPCDASCDVCGSYTGYYLRTVPTPGLTDTLFYGLRTFYVKQNPQACIKYITTDPDSGFVGYFTSDAWNERYIGSDGNLYIYNYGYAYGSTKYTYTKFMGEKD